MTQDEIIRMAREAGFGQPYVGAMKYELKRFAALVAAHVKSDQIQTAYQQGCEDMKRRMEKRMQQLEGQLQLCKTAVADEREACANVAEAERMEGDRPDGLLPPEIIHAVEVTCQQTAESIAAAIRARGEK